ncbi:hypothetical protein CFP56_040532 [Quercus suber]|uniref:Uncharacterized protein n=1 Tax=Quercus suber TaxID=58331 RepID=A0AAW0LN46_QUESU
MSERISCRNVDGQGKAEVELPMEVELDQLLDLRLSNSVVDGHASKVANNLLDGFDKKSPKSLEGPEPFNESLNRALGVHMRSMIHKPFHSRPHAGVWYGKEVWSKPQYGVHHLSMDDYWVAGGGLQPRDMMGVNLRDAIDDFEHSSLISNSTGSVANNRIASLWDFQGNSFSRNQQLKAPGLDFFKIIIQPSVQPFQRI